MRSRDVSIVDNEGNLLTQSMESADSERTEMEASYREQLEKAMSSKVVSILEQAVGKGKVHVTASLDMDFTTTEQMEETYNPNPAGTRTVLRPVARAQPEPQGIPPPEEPEPAVVETAEGTEADDEAGAAAPEPEAEPVPVPVGDVSGNGSRLGADAGGESGEPAGSERETDEEADEAPDPVRTA